MITNIHSAQIIESDKRNKKTGEKIKKSVSIIQDNKYMKCVDRADQYLSYYSILRKCREWSKRVTMYLINCSFFKAFRVYKKLHSTK